MKKKQAREPAATIKISDVKEAFDIVKNECERLAGELGMKPSAADVIRFAVISTAKQYSGSSGTSTGIKLSREEFAKRWGDIRRDAMIEPLIEGEPVPKSICDGEYKRGPGSQVSIGGGEYEGDTGE